jgi:L,D-peptidoglycan transpeptidase YkuD (ErfK/YbiS/YcfS/YnhG family)
MIGLMRRGDRERPLPTTLAQSLIKEQMGWCDDPAHRRYNRQVQLPFSGSHEQLWRADRAYDLVLVLDYNIKPRVRRRGSAIFFHLTRPGSNGTEGCVAISSKHMRMILPRIGRHTKLVIW